MIFNCDKCVEYFFTDANLKLHKRNQYNTPKEKDEQDTGQTSKNGEKTKGDTQPVNHPENDQRSIKIQKVQDNVENKESQNQDIISEESNTDPKANYN